MEEGREGFPLKSMSALHLSFNIHPPSLPPSLPPFSYGFDYTTRDVVFHPRPPPLPFLHPSFKPVLNRLLDRGLLRVPPNQMTLNEYMPGQGINGHIEAHDAFRDGVVSLSLGRRGGREGGREGLVVSYVLF